MPHSSKFPHDGSREHEDNIARVVGKEEDIDKKMSGQRAFKKVLESGRLLLGMIKDYFTGAYREVPYWAISAGALSLLYVLNPADVIPDMILGVGYLDDATVVAFCLKLIERELVKYKEWQAARKPSPPAKAGKIIDV